MKVYWYYSNFNVEINVYLVHHGKKYEVPIYGGESPAHVFLKLSIAVHLLKWGYSWEQIFWEKVLKTGKKYYRADIFVEPVSRLPAFWFECGDTDVRKLKAVAKKLSNVRVVQVIDYQDFEHLWNCDTVLHRRKVVNLDSIKDVRIRKHLVQREREAIVPVGTELWGVNAFGGNPRIFYAVRREMNGDLIYLDTGEGRSLSSFRYISKSRRYYAPLIPGVVGSEEWRGENSFHANG